MAFNQKNTLASGALIHVYRRRQISLIIRLVFLFVVACIVLAFLYIKIADLVINVRTKNGQYKSSIDGLNAIATLHEEESAADVVYPRLQRLMPSAIDIPSLVIPAMKKLAEDEKLQAGIEIGSETPSGVSTASVISFTVSARGPLANIERFFEKLESGDQIIKVNSFTITNSGANQYELNLAGQVYASPST